MQGINTLPSPAPDPPPPPSQILSVFLIGLLIPLATTHYPATAAVGVGLAAVALFAVAIVGIVAALTHHQVVLFCVSLNQREKSGVTVQLGCSEHVHRV